MSCYRNTVGQLQRCLLEALILPLPSSHPHIHSVASSPPKGYGQTQQASSLACSCISFSSSRLACALVVTSSALSHPLSFLPANNFAHSGASVPRHMARCWSWLLPPQCYDLPLPGKSLSPYTHCIATASPSFTLHSSTNFQCTMVHKHPESTRMSSTDSPSTTPDFNTPGHVTCGSLFSVEITPCF